MLEYLTQLPWETLGQNMLGFLDLNDIIEMENAAASQKSQQLLRAILPYCPPIVVSNSWNRVKFNHIVCNWFSNRRCRVQFMKIPIESLCEVNFEPSVLYDITLCLKEKASLEDVSLLNDTNISHMITKLHIKGKQDPAVMELLFSLLTNSSVHRLDVQSLNLSQWMEYIKKIGLSLRELIIVSCNIQLKSITEHCPYLEKLSLSFQFGVSDSSNILQSIASNCTHLRILHIINMIYISNLEADADLTAFAEKCPQLEELSLDCQQLTDQSVIALAQHCSRLKKLKLIEGRYAIASLIALSERGLPLEKLVIIPWIPISSAEIAAQCAHALSRIRELSTQYIDGSVVDMRYAIQYMPGLRELYLDSADDHLLVPHLLLLLQGQCCAGLESLNVGSKSSITPQQLCELVRWCLQLQTLYIDKPACTSDAVLVELACSCHHLQRVTLNSSEVTEEGVLALAAHCRQLRELNILNTTVTEETVRLLAQHCPHLTKLLVVVRKGEVMALYSYQHSNREIRAVGL